MLTARPRKNVERKWLICTNVVSSHLWI